MKSFAEFKKEVKDLIGRSRTKKAIELIELGLGFEESTSMDHLILIKSSYNEWADEQMDGTLGHDQLKVEKRRINSSLMTFLGNLEEQEYKGDINPSHLKDLATKIKEAPICLLAGDDTRAEALKDRFELLGFSKLTPAYFTGNWEEIDYSKADLIVFDNMDLPNEKRRSKLEKQDQLLVENRTNKMDHFIEKYPKKTLFHFGKTLIWLDNHRDRVQASNSRFTLLARIKEVLEYLYTYRA